MAGLKAEVATSFCFVPVIGLRLWGYLDGSWRCRARAYEGYLEMFTTFVDQAVLVILGAWFSVIVVVGAAGREGGKP